MTIVHGQIESLKSIRATLNRNGIDRFNSVGEINFFIENYESERKRIIDQAASDLENEIATLEARKIELTENYDEVTVIETDRLKNEIAAIEGKYNLVDSKVRNAIGRLFQLFRLKILKSRKE